MIKSLYYHPRSTQLFTLILFILYTHSELGISELKMSYPGIIVISERSKSTFLTHFYNRQYHSIFFNYAIGCINATMDINPLTAGAEYIGFFNQLLPHSVPPFKHKP